MKIFIMGAGHMGSWFVEEFCHDHNVAVFDKDPKKLKYFFNVERYLKLEEVREFKPEIVINCVPLHLTKKAFEEVIDLVPNDTIFVDIMSVKTGIHDFYKEKNLNFTSLHPMFGPTFANIRNLSSENTIIIKESCDKGKEFFRKFFNELKLNIYEYTFKEHDEVTAYSLSVPFASTMVFGACMKNIDAPGTTFKKHMNIAKGLLSEDDYLLAEIMFNPNTLDQIQKINAKLSYLTHIIKDKDFEEMQKFLNGLRENILAK